MAKLTPEEVQELAVCIVTKLFPPTFAATYTQTRTLIEETIEEYLEREVVVTKDIPWKIGCYEDEEGIITYPDRGC